MKLLISFCNQQEEQVHDNLVIFDTDNQQSTSFLHTIPNKGATGLALDVDNIFCCYQCDPGGIVILDRNTFEIKLNQILSEAFEPHSILLDGKYLYIVSSGTDSILKYEYNNRKNKLSFVEKVFQYPGTDGSVDMQHMNSIQKLNDEIFFTGFGPKVSEKWSSAVNGYIMNASTNKIIIENIYHPHSLLIKDNNFWYCESAKERICKNGKAIIEGKQGYTRGLAIKDDYLVFGASTRRNMSRSLKTPNSTSNPDEFRKVCAILIAQISTNEIKSRFDFSDKYQEIYDILFV